MENSKLRSELEFAAKFMGDSVLRLARYFHDVRASNPHDLIAVANIVGIELGYARYLADVEAKFRELEIDEDLLTVIGWAKLRLLVDRLDETNCDELLSLAQSSSVRELAMMMEDRIPLDGTRYVVLRLNPRQYDVFCKAILYPYGEMGAVKKEEALFNVLTKVL